MGLVVLVEAELVGALSPRAALASCAGGDVGRAARSSRDVS